MMPVKNNAVGLQQPCRQSKVNGPKWRQLGKPSRFEHFLSRYGMENLPKSLFTCVCTQSCARSIKRMIFSKVFNIKFWDWTVVLVNFVPCWKESVHIFYPEIYQPHHVWHFPQREKRSGSIPAKSAS